METERCCVAYFPLMFLAYFVLLKEEGYKKIFAGGGVNRGGCGPQRNFDNLK